MRFDWPTLLWGERTVTVLSDGLQHLDGGAMFGVVPRVLWEKKLPADDRNRIRLGMNCLLVVGPEGRAELAAAWLEETMTPTARHFLDIVREWLPRHGLGGKGPGLSSGSTRR